MCKFESNFEVLDKIVALNLDVTLWTGRKKLEAQDLGGVNLPPEDLASLGSKRIADLGYSIEVSDAAKEFVATKGYDVQFGARPLKRAIQTYIEDGICERILSGEIKQGETIKVDKPDGSDKLTFE